MTVMPKPVPPDALDAIRAIVGPKGWIDDPSDMLPFLKDERGLFVGKAPAVVRPASTEEVAAVMRICAANQIAIVPQGGNTGLCGGSVPFEAGDAIVLSLGRMNRVRAVDAINYTITVEAGVILAEVQAEADRNDRLFPLSLGAEGSCQIGGNLSTNAGGIQVLRYGNARDLVLGLEVVLPDGQVWNGLRGLRKDNTGYDLKHLFVGSEGTLGIITAAVLKLFPKPRDIKTAFVALPGHREALELFALARGASGDQLTAFELIPRIGLEFSARHVPGVVDPLERPYSHYVLMEMSSSVPDGDIGQTMDRFLETAMERGLVLDGTVAASAQQATQLWRIREGIVESQKHEGGSIKHDIAVPVSLVGDFLDEASRQVEERLPGIRVVAFGHIGDGNIHFNLSQPVGADTKAYLARWAEFNEIVHRVVAGMNGSISAEHGIGRLKRDVLPDFKSGLELDLMRKVKRALDPAGIMNPGKVL
ncbi:4-phosphoerythronate dehydrogenase (FAD-dependent) [Stella humosa]|uniref:4-phosphoerythronate dehydrogenase (FAD-dependent) n=1 Tax=Stella humosa TaxID=94 RepID=A0A3N1KVC2_9PROT|nr:FAD-binding oxidoreductase [Stella humosa]ROP83197.1 4-phosphoerythronate dehydrogenase (FAD-dependent) [Stella humosa]BBK30024.1 D-2-hydroxyacid dehydrogenase [Stella humosa]